MKINIHKTIDPFDHPPIKKGGTLKSSGLTFKKLKEIIPNKPKNPIIEKRILSKLKGFPLNIIAML